MHENPGILKLAKIITVFCDSQNTDIKSIIWLSIKYYITRSFHRCPILKSPMKQQDKIRQTLKRKDIIKCCLILIHTSQRSQSITKLVLIAGIFQNSLNESHRSITELAYSYFIPRLNSILKDAYRIKLQ